MSRKQKSQWKPETRLDATGIPFIDVVLTERFLLPPQSLQKIGEKVPETLGEVVDLSGMPLDEVMRVIDECIEIGRDIWIDLPAVGDVVSDEKTIVVDMRPDVTFETDPLHEAARLFHLENPQVILPLLRSMDRVLVLSYSEAHAWSATMSLRKMGIKAWMPRQALTP